MSKKPSIQEQITEFTSSMRARGFMPQLHAGRPTYYMGTLRVLGPTSHVPFWTVQQLAGGHVSWFVDFPMESPLSSVLAYVDSFSKAPTPSPYEFAAMEKRVTKVAGVLDKCATAILQVAAHIDKPTMTITCSGGVVIDVEVAVTELNRFLGTKHGREEKGADAARASNQSATTGSTSSD